VGTGSIFKFIGWLYKRRRTKTSTKSIKVNNMAPKKLEENSKYAHLDLDGDGIVDDEEMAMERSILEMEELRSHMENDDKKQDAQRAMAWFALFGMLLYPFAVVIAVFIGLDKAASILGDMAPTYFVSVAAIVAAFYAKEVMVKK
jgi:hypothetical protein